MEDIVLVIVKSFTLNDERLKKLGVGRKCYWKGLLEHIGNAC